MTPSNLNNPANQNPQNNGNLNGGAAIPPPPAVSRQPVNPRQSQQASTSGNAGQKVAIGLGAAAVSSGATAAGMAFFGGEPKPEDNKDVVKPEEEKKEETVETNDVKEPVNPTKQPSKQPVDQKKVDELNAREKELEQREQEVVERENEVEYREIELVNRETDIYSRENELDEKEQELRQREKELDNKEKNPDEKKVEEPIDPEKIEDPVDIDKEVDILIAEDLTDTEEPVEIGRVNFVGVDTTFDDQGNEVVVGTYADQNGNLHNVVDLDNDGYFDQYVDYNGNLCGDASRSTLTVSDAEEQVTNGYLAQSNEIETQNEDLGDEYLNDITTV